MKVNAVFEGGGVKAVALVGALKAAEERGVKFDKTAGTSSGSIVAALIAAGYRADEMKKLIVRTPFSSFIKTAGHRGTIGSIVRLLMKKGLYSGESLEHWVRKILLEKGIRTFADLPPQKLRIIASDISQGKLLVLPEDIAQYGIEPGALEVSRAIRMSTSLPYFFEPVLLRKPLDGSRGVKSFKNQFYYIVDGGILSNFPLWLFDKEDHPGGVAEVVPTIGFQLVGQLRPEPHEIHGPFSMFRALLETMMDAHDEKYIMEHNRFRTIKIPTLGVGTTQFNMTADVSRRLFDSGYKASRHFFDKWTMTAYIHQYAKHIGTL